MGLFKDSRGNPCVHGSFTLVYAACADIINASFHESAARRDLNDAKRRGDSQEIEDANDVYEYRRARTNSLLNRR